MINWLINKWRSYQFRQALQQNNYVKAQILLKEIERSGVRLSWLERLFKKQLESEQSLTFYRREFAHLSQKTKAASNYLKQEFNFIDFIYNTFKLVEHDRHKIQCTGIDNQVFNELEKSLVDFLQEEINKIPKERLTLELKQALQDLTGLKRGRDPSYRFLLSPHVYFMKYFLENVYCSYLAWFLIYQSGYLSSHLSILDIAAGPGTVLYGLALLLQSSHQFFPTPFIHISYYSLEQQDTLQYRGLQFWRRYHKVRSHPINTYFCFETANLFEYDTYSEKLPQEFFNFIVISHCFFYEPEKRQKAHTIYRNIFQRCLSVRGHVLLIIQGRKLWSAYEMSQQEDLEQEAKAIALFLEELGLKLEWYKYLTSTPQRTPLRGEVFGKFARNNLPKLNNMNDLIQKYLGQNSLLHYSIDDYVILAKPCISK